MDLKLEIYSTGLDLVGMLEIQNSVIWESKAFTAGNFSVQSIITDQTRSLLVPENIIWIEGDTAGIIERFDQKAGADGPYISVNGPDLTGILSRRILWGQYDLTGTVSQIMRYLVADCCITPTRGDTKARKIPGLQLASLKDGGPTIRVQKTGGELLKALEELGSAYNIAFGVKFVPAQYPTKPHMEFWCRPGIDRSIHQSANNPVFYSTELDDVLESEYSYNSQDYKNVALVAGEGEGDDRTVVVVEAHAAEPPTPPEPPIPVTKYTITLAVDPQGGGLTSGSGTYDNGASVTVTATPSANYEFVAWKDGETVVSTNSSYTFTASQNRSLTAVFAAVTPVYVITVSVDPAEGGTASGGGSYEQGQSITLTQTTSSGYTFSGWYSGNTLLSSENTYSFIPTESISITAKYAIIPVYTVTATIDPFGAGTVTGAGQYQKGESATLTATAKDGYEFTKYTIDGQDVYTDESYTFTVTKNVSVVAVFEQKIIWVPDWKLSTLPSSLNWQSVAFGNGKFVTVAGTSKIASYSEDGINWLNTTLPASVYWFNVAYGNGKFVVVASSTSGSTTRSAYSTDGINWTAATLPVSGTWRCITYGDGKFVALSGSAKAAYSTDGINWTATTLPASGSWYGVTYGNGKFVAVEGSSSSSNKAIYSEDGINWTLTTLPAAMTWQSVAYGKGKFVAVGFGSAKTAYSVDGINWTETTMPSSANWQSVAYGDGKFIAVAYNSNKAAYSEDGINWTAKNLPTSAYWREITYGDEKFVVVSGNSGNKVAYTLS